MAKSINQVLIMGNLTRNPELRTIANGTEVVRFSLALNRSFQDSQGNMQESTDYVDVVAWGRLAGQVAERLTVGSRCIVNGRIQSSSWDDKETGKKRSKIEILAEDVTFVDKAAQIEVKQA